MRIWSNCWSENSSSTSTTPPHFCPCCTTWTSCRNNWNEDHATGFGCSCSRKHGEIICQQGVKMKKKQLVSKTCIKQPALSSKQRRIKRIIKVTPPELSLTQLLKEVEELFGHTPSQDGGGCYDFMLGKFPSGWAFSVINSWHKWSAAGRKHQFKVYPTPEDAVMAFLNYVKAENIWPAGLTND
jgi:hypothetical protein